MKKHLRTKEIHKRKNFFPTLVITLLLWIFLAVLVYFVEPDFTFVAILFTFSTLLTNSRRGLIFALALTLFLILRYFGVGNIINFLLIMGVAITTEIYFQKRK
jgi:hypothetical protein